MTQAAILAASATSGVSQSLKNRIINGAMVIDQRNAGASVTALNTAPYTLDRFYALSVPSSKYTVQQNAGSVTPPVGFTNYAGITSTSAYSVTSTDYMLFRQVIEGYNIADLGYGTANAKTVTLSFWVRSSLTGTFGGSLSNTASDYSYPFSYTISAANTWEQKSITIAGPTSGTWNVTNGVGIALSFGLGVGSTYSGTAGAWASGFYGSTTGATSVVGTNGATFYITGVQLEVGTTATNFEYRQYGTELALCERYYQDFTDRSANGYAGFFTGYVASGGYNISMYMTFPTAMRIAPAITISGWAGGIQPSPLSGTNGTALYYSAGSGGLFTFRSGAGVFNASAEL